MLSRLSRGRPLPRPAFPARALAAPPPPPPPPPGDAAADSADAAKQAEAAVRSGWDPEGLFGSAPSAAPAAAGAGVGAGSGDLFARQQARRAAAQQQRRHEQEQEQRTAAQADATTAAAAALVAARAPLPPPPPPPPLESDEPVVPVPDEWAAYDDDDDMAGAGAPSPPPGGPLVARLPPAARAELAASAAAVFPGFDLGRPGLRVLHLRPLVLAVDGFASPEDCEAWAREADASGRLATSRVGAGHAGGGGGSAAAAAASSASPASVSYDAAQRTSSNLLVDATTRKIAPVLGLLADAFQERAMALLDAAAPPPPPTPPPPTPTAAASSTVAGAASPSPHHHRPGASWGVPGRMPLPRQYTFEAPQVTRYLPPAAAAAARGQLFGAHEDGFPRAVARANGFQRHATLLLYLNGRDAAREGGATRFAHLRAPSSGSGGGGGGGGGGQALAVTPVRGRLLIFFPSLDDGTPDARTLHAADEVLSGDPKWVMQQWVARGYASPSALRHMQQQQQQQQAGGSSSAVAGGGGSGSGGGSDGARTPTRKKRREQARKEAALSKHRQQGARRRAD